MIKTECDRPRCRNSGFNELICPDCFNDLENQLEQANSEIEELKEKIKELEAEDGR